MNVEDRLALIREVGEEIVTEDELRALLDAKAHPVCYDGFEPSGRIHIAQGILRAINVNKMTRAGCTFKMFVADWHAWANNKMGGDLEKIQTVGHYFVDVWRAAGMDLDHVKFVWASEFVTDEAYWKKVMNIARDSSLDRILRTTQIMGRSEKDKLAASQILYPCMQAADIFHLEADITQLGMDQRKVNMLAREVAPKYGYAKPVVVSHHMLMGLQAPPAVPQELSYESFRGRIEQAVNALKSIDPVSTKSSLIPDNIRKIFADAFSGKLFEFSDSSDAFDRELTAYLSAADRLTPSLVEPYLGPESSMPQAEYITKSPVATSLAERITHYRLLRHTVGDVDLGQRSAKLFLLLQAEYKLIKALQSEIAEIYNSQLRRRETFALERAIALKMSKSNPDSAVFMTDTPADVERKMKNAFCPQKQVDENPVLEYFRYIIFQRHWLDPKTAQLGESPIAIQRPEKFGGNVTYPSYAALAEDFAAGKVHPMDIKKAAARYVNELLESTRQHFEKDVRARSLKDQVDAWQVTR